MRYVAAYLLAVLEGKASPAAADVDRILTSFGIKADEGKLNEVVAELNGKSLDDLISLLHDKLICILFGVSVVATSEAAEGAPTATEENKDDKKEAKKEESESEDDERGFALFD